MYVVCLVLSFRKDRYRQTVKTLGRLLLKEQSDQGLHCLLFHVHLLHVLLHGGTSTFEF